MTANSTALKALSLSGLVSLALLFSAPDSTAQFNVFITGQVVDPLGLGVAGVDIDVDNMGGGGDPDLFNDGTDAGGFFTTTVEEAGTFHFSFRPPVPPTTSLLIKILPDVTVIVGTTSLGVIPLDQGVDVQGTCVGPTGLPAGNINFDILDTNGSTIKVGGAFTTLFGTFRFAAPPGPAEWRMNTLGVISETLAPIVLDVTFAGTSMNMGNIVLPRGYHFTATLLQPGGLPLVAANTNTSDSATGESIYTPGDSSNALGVVDLVLAAGTYDMIVCPAVATGLVAMGFDNVPISANFNAGIFTLQAGVVLSGVVRDNLNQPVQGVNIDIEDSLGAELMLCGDNTSATGTYALVVPTGTWRLEYNPSFALPLGAAIQDNMVISVNTVNDVLLQACPTHTPYGTGLAGKGGFVPTLSASGGSARVGNPDFALEISGGLGKGSAVIVSGFEASSTPFLGGTLLVGGPVPPNSQSTGLSGTGVGMAGSSTPFPRSLVFGMTTVRLDGVRGAAGTGSLTISEPIPSSPSLVGFTRYVQVLVKDNAAVQGVAMSNGISIRYCD